MPNINLYPTYKEVKADGLKIAKAMELETVDGRITSPGRYEGEMVTVLALQDYALNGDHGEYECQTVDGWVTGYRLGNGQALALIEDEYGFAYVRRYSSLMVLDREFSARAIDSMDVA